jgi:hypothetical protein
MTPDQILLRRIRWCSAFFVVALILSGLTAIPLETELDLLRRWTAPWAQSPFGILSGLSGWIEHVQAALRETNTKYPFLAYGTDWLAFGHVVIGLSFVGAWRDPVRNAWLFDFGLLACALVIPWAFVFGGLRGIPWGWRLIDCSFGVFGAIPLWYCRAWTRELEERRRGVA